MSKKKLPLTPTLALLHANPAAVGVIHQQLLGYAGFEGEENLKRGNME